MNTSEIEKPSGLLVVDPHRLMRTALCDKLRASERWASVREADHAEEALQILENYQPECIIAETALPCRSGIELIHELRSRKLSIPVVILSGQTSPHLVDHAFEEGAAGYISKSARYEELLVGLSQALDGKPYTSPDITEQLHSRTEVVREREAPITDPLRPLSRREREIFFHLVSGEHNAGIARTLHISPRTVETHRARIVKKLGLRTNGELIRFAIRNEVSAA